MCAGVFAEPGPIARVLWALSSCARILLIQDPKSETNVNGWEFYGPEHVSSPAAVQEMLASNEAMTWRPFEGQLKYEAVAMLDELKRRIDFGELALSTTIMEAKNSVVPRGASSAMTRQSSKLRQPDTQQSGWQQQHQAQEQQEDSDRMAQLETEIMQKDAEIARLRADNDHLRSLLELPPPSEGV